MSKLRSDSLWNQLTPEQHHTLEGWLFDENMTYQAARDRVQQEWGLDRTYSSVVRFYRHCAKSRAINGMPGVLFAARQINQIGGDLAELRTSTHKIISKRLFEQSVNADNLKELAVLGKIICAAEEREIRRQRLYLARERWQFNAAKAALKAKPQLDELAQEEEARDLARIQAIKIAIFGKKLVDEIENANKNTNQ